MKPYRIFVRYDVRNEIQFSEVADSLQEARELVLTMSKWWGGHDDDPQPYVDDEDEMLVVDVDGKLVMAFKNEAFVDIGTIAPFELPDPWFLGIDVVKNGISIFGTDLDPWGLKKNDLLRNEAADVAKAWVKENPGFHLVQRFQGDMREETTYHIMPSESSPSPAF
ncbi:hypothetical protein [Rhizobium sp. MHM7A]|uniref:hypothetical protein n=1 Tax=Rhizobium sp. MHM7A TaxID=2583233 RepID=UPI0011070C92|nr:hypothetical protein [Rhizobium sp. MHM7A]TLX16143.1 hypothetical protein FFR93_02120 [Rhizobium sp. MHM7A]